MSLPDRRLRPIGNDLQSPRSLRSRDREFLVAQAPLSVQLQKLAEPVDAVGSVVARRLSPAGPVINATNSQTGRTERTAASSPNGPVANRARRRSCAERTEGGMARPWFAPRPTW